MAICAEQHKTNVLIGGYGRVCSILQDPGQQEGRIAKTEWPYDPPKPSLSTHCRYTGRVCCCAMCLALKQTLLGPTNQATQEAAGRPILGALINAL